MNLPKLFFSQFAKYVAHLGIRDEDTVQLLGCVLQKRALEFFDELISEFRKHGEVCDFNTVNPNLCLWGGYLPHC